MSPFSFLVIVGIALAMTPFISGCMDDERSYLLDFKGGLVDPTGRLTLWQGHNCCQWEAVSCDYHSGHVIGLHLKARQYETSVGYIEVDQQLSGEIHPSLFKLRHLQHLDLSWNFFNGTAISPQFAKLNRLTFLSLSNAVFGGEVPVEMGNLSSLVYLDLSAVDYINDYHELKSSRFSEWVRNLRRLEYLAMDRVDLSMASEDWGAALTSLSNLKQIHMFCCGLSGIIPPLLNLTHLTHLHLSQNSFPFPLPAWFQNVSSLVSLDLYACGINSSIPSDFLHRSSLSSIKMSANYLRGNLSFILHHFSSLAVLSLQRIHPNGVTSSGGLGGVIPSFANFSNLQRLNLAGNNFTGYIPEFGSALSWIDLSFCNLKGSIPSSIVGLSSLVYLDLSFNQLTGHIPSSLGMLYALGELYLEYNQLSGNFPDMSKLLQLEIIRLNSNNVTGNLSLSMFENMTHLKSMDLSRNQLTVHISSSWIPKFSHLCRLGLMFCNIDGYFPSFLSTQYWLNTLDLSHNNLVGEIPTWLFDFPNLLVLNLSNNQLQGSLPRIKSEYCASMDLHGNRLHGSLPPLDISCSILDLSENEFNGSIPERILPSAVVLSGNNLAGEIPHSMCTDGSSFLFLDLSKNSLKGLIPPNLGRCSNLRVLDLAQNYLQGKMPKELGNLTSLQTLNVNDNNLHGAIPSSIVNCKYLQVLDIGNNKIQGNIPAWIGELPQLRILSLTSNIFQGSIPPWLHRLQKLQILDLSYNNLRGHIPANLGELDAMINQSQSAQIELAKNSGFVGADVQYIFLDAVTLWIKGRVTPYPKIIKAFKFMDLSHNRLSGQIPPEIGLLKGLIALNISKNNLSGSIPQSLGGMAQLESLDLSGNKLSGKIPAQLVDLTFLAVLNLSDNMLSGIIPQGKQFSTFEASSFLGNPDLHGPQLENTTGNSRLGERGRQEEERNKRDAEAVEDEAEVDSWWAISVGLSFGVGFACVIGVLALHRRWGHRCFFLMDNLIECIFQR